MRHQATTPEQVILDHPDAVAFFQAYERFFSSHIQSDGGPVRIAGSQMGAFPCQNADHFPFDQLVG